MNDLIMWLQEPGKWNDGVVLCGVLLVVCLAVMIKHDGKNFWKNF